jgi:hypothetical protein
MFSNAAVKISNLATSRNSKFFGVFSHYALDERIVFIILFKRLC